jgi:hypothetical protein
MTERATVTCALADEAVLALTLAFCAWFLLA